MEFSVFCLKLCMGSIFNNYKLPNCTPTILFYNSEKGTFSHMGRFEMDSNYVHVNQHFQPIAWPLMLMGGSVPSFQVGGTSTWLFQLLLSIMELYRVELSCFFLFFIRAVLCETFFFSLFFLFFVSFASRVEIGEIVIVYYCREIFEEEGRFSSQVPNFEIFVFAFGFIFQFCYFFTMKP